MARYKTPTCVAELPNGRPCNHDMHPLGERDPAFGPDFKPGVWVFQCNYCGAVRALDRTKLDRYAQRA